MLSLWLPRITNNITLFEWCLFAMSMYRGMGNMWRLKLHILNYTCCTIRKPYFSLNKESAYMLSISKATHTSREEEVSTKGIEPRRHTKRGIEVTNRGKGKSMRNLVWNGHTYNVKVIKPPLGDFWASSWFLRNLLYIRTLSFLSFL